MYFLHDKIQNKVWSYIVMVKSQRKNKIDHAKYFLRNRHPQLIQKIFNFITIQNEKMNLKNRKIKWMKIKQNMLSCIGIKVPTHLSGCISAATSSCGEKGRKGRNWTDWRISVVEKDVEKDVEKEVEKEVEKSGRTQSHRKICIEEWVNYVSFMN